MKTQTIIILIIVIILISIFLIIKPSLTGKIVYQEISNEKIKLGYCPTMQEDAEKLSEKENYQLIKFGSASEVLNALNNNQINKALIGRKAKNYEISKEIKETTLKSGHTLVFKQKGFIESSQLSNLEIYTYLSEEQVKKLIPDNKNIIYLPKQQAISKIPEGKIVLISWEDWQDEFELIVIIDENEKDKNFRGVFLYEN